MKKLLIIFSIVAWGCQSETAPNCLKSAGDKITRNVELPDFDKLFVNNEFNVIITAGLTPSASITIGENLINDVDFDVVDSELIITDNISCRWVRDYDFPIIQITHPNITTIEVAGGSIISSSSTLNYPSITLRSKDSNGDFNLDVICNSLIVWSNEISNFNLTGSVVDLNVNFTSGDGRFQGGDLLITNAAIFHNGTNLITVNVIENLKGSITSTGDLFYVGNTPNSIQVSDEGRGNLINGTN